MVFVFRTFITFCISAGLALAQSQEWGQCGGIGWPGPTTCVSGTICTVMNPYYSQCIPGSVASTTSSPTTISSSSTRSTTSPSPTSTGTTGLNIRLLPLGDSITYGFTSSDGNGYRATLHNALEPGNTLDFIGSIKSGTMVDNDNEGHIGATIQQIAQAAVNPLALPARPNVVLLMAGTNDMIDIPGSANTSAPTQLSSLIDTIFTTCPDAAIIVSTLTPLTITTTIQTQVNTFNTIITQMINARTAAGQHILVAQSMATTILPSDLIDGIHPTDAGYVKMANVWYPVIEQAARNGWIGKPVTV
ncbi:hypothetical protein D9757_013944 [Collybiopsis confluens]|uniref:CBM1 domain-containing protein n=1 Tax=Collybiopsis confluens TaxID=2823264 RepID=A0A8H5G8J5_9AGAR|nr:hypothetical protein D9757_013944 [Collybiopsis confluens]